MVEYFHKVQQAAMAQVILVSDMSYEFEQLSKRLEEIFQKVLNEVIEGGVNGPT